MTDMTYKGIAQEARKAIGCEGGWMKGDCFANLPEMNDHDPCDRCHLAWRIACFEEEAQVWWDELEEKDQPCMGCGHDPTALTPEECEALLNGW